VASDSFLGLWPRPAVQLTGAFLPRQIDVTELILRDAHQSLLATRMALEDMVPACADPDQAGYWSIECWGGATFDAAIRFLNEDPWEIAAIKVRPGDAVQAGEVVAEFE
jgi:pyruvate carboxylase